MDIEIFVFSFNRGPHLKNCLQSIATYAPGIKVTVVDDGSQDPETVKVLQETNVPVVQPKSDASGRLGGLYPNMQWALDNCESELALYLQDDVQIVRPIEELDHQIIDEFFAANASHVFINPSFRMGPRSKRRRADHHTWEPFQGYSFDSGRSDQSTDTRRWFIAVGLCHARRLKALGWKYAPTESQNAKQASTLFSPILHLAVPFVSQLPEVSTLRFGKRSFGARLAESLSGNWVNSFRPMTNDEITALRALPLGQVPLAEEWVHSVNPRVRKPYIHKGVNARWYTRALNKVEVRAKRIFRSLSPAGR